MNTATGWWAAAALCLSIASIAPVASSAERDPELRVASDALAGDAAAEADAARPPNPLTLAWCLARARDASPALARARADSDAARHRIGPAGAFADPRFGYEASNLPTGSFDFDSTPLSGHQLTLRQKLPFFGLRGSRRRAARLDAEAASLLVDDEQLVVVGAVEAAWAELAFAQRALDITDGNVALLRQLAATAEARYRVGDGLQQDVLRAQVELTALLEERLRREAAIAHAEARLVELLDLPAAARLPRASDPRVSSAEPALDPLLAALDARSPRLSAARKRVAAAEADVRSAEVEGYPDLDVGLGYRVRSRVAGDPVAGEDFFSAGVTLRLPVDRGKWRARTAERKAMLRRARADLREARAALVSQARAAHAELTRATREEALLETGLVPQATQSLASSRSAYEVGRIDFPSLLDSQVRLLDAELRLERVRADRRLAYVALEVATGEKLR